MAAGWPMEAGTGCGWSIAEGTGPARSIPVIPIQTAILDRLGEVFGGHRLRPAQIGDSARHFEDAIMCPRRKSHPPHGHLEGSLARVIQPADFAQNVGWHMRVVESAALLNQSRLQDPCPHLGRGLARAFGPHLLVSHGGDFNMEVDAVQEGAADFTEVTLDFGAGAAALAGGVAAEAAAAGVQITTAPSMNVECRADAGTRNVTHSTKHWQTVCAQGAQVGPAPPAWTCGTTYMKDAHPGLPGATCVECQPVGVRRRDSAAWGVAGSGSTGARQSRSSIQPAKGRRMITRASLTSLKTACPTAN